MEEEKDIHVVGISLADSKEVFYRTSVFSKAMGVLEFLSQGEVEAWEGWRFQVESYLYDGDEKCPHNTSYTQYPDNSRYCNTCGCTIYTGPQELWDQ